VAVPRGKAKGGSKHRRRAIPVANLTKADVACFAPRGTP
jgi:hypothetical protein